MRNPEPKVGYVLNFTKVCSMRGEQYAVTGNLPVGANVDAFKKEWEKMLAFPQERMQTGNDEMLEIEKRKQADLEAGKAAVKKFNNKGN